NMSKRVQNMDISKISTKENLANMIVILSMRPAEAKKLFDLVFTESEIHYGSKHAFRIHGESEDSSPKDEHNSELKSEFTENDEISDIINIYSY
ncbi:6154_t:CDS:2, partial [Rhizophagus irregularis]